MIVFFFFSGQTEDGVISLVELSSLLRFLFLCFIFSIGSNAKPTLDPSLSPNARTLIRGLLLHLEPSSG